MVLSYAQKKEIHQHFIFHELEQRQIAEKTNDIILAGSYEMSKTGVFGSTVSDQTFEKVQRIERELGRLRLWVNVIGITVKHFKNTVYEDFLAGYMQREPKIKTMERCFISSERTYYAYRDEVITYAAFKAVEQGLITI